MCKHHTYSITVPFVQQRGSTNVSWFALIQNINLNVQGTGWKLHESSRALEVLLLVKMHSWDAPCSQTNVCILPMRRLKPREGRFLVQRHSNLVAVRPTPWVSPDSWLGALCKDACSAAIRPAASGAAWAHHRHLWHAHQVAAGCGLEQRTVSWMHPSPGEAQRQCPLWPEAWALEAGEYQPHARTTSFQKTLVKSGILLEHQYPCL